MSKKKTQKRGKHWGIPENAAAYFDPHYDDDFKDKHPVLYWLTVVAIIVFVVIGPIFYIFLCSTIQSTMTLLEVVFWMIGFVSSFGISLGICNLFMIVHKQYLGHYVTLYSFAIGIAGSGLGLLFLWLI